LRRERRRRGCSTQRQFRSIKNVISYVGVARSIPLALALHGGEDFELLFTVSSGNPRV
jgi:thiamine monophosphate kinase